MEPARARELLATERARIERALVHLEREDTYEHEDDVDLGDVGSELYQDEFDEGRADDLREELAAVERAEARLAAGTYGLADRRVAMEVTLTEGTNQVKGLITGAPGSLRVVPTSVRVRDRDVRKFLDRLFR